MRAEGQTRVYSRPGASAKRCIDQCNASPKRAHALLRAVGRLEGGSAFRVGVGLWILERVCVRPTVNRRSRDWNKKEKQAEATSVD